MIANVLSASRIALALPFALLLHRSTEYASMTAGDSRIAFIVAGIFVFAIASDLLDGAVARSLGTESEFGHVLDHLADVVFVLAGLIAASLWGAIPWVLPLLVAVAFAQYAFDSYMLHRAPALIPSLLGRWNGILYFVPLGGVCLVNLGFDSLAVPTRIIAWVLVVTTCASIGHRLVLLPRG